MPRRSGFAAALNAFRMSRVHTFAELRDAGVRQELRLVAGFVRDCVLGTSSRLRRGPANDEKSLVLVCPGVPTPDRDAGSVRLMRIAEVAKAAGFEVSVLPLVFTSAEDRERVLELELSYIPSLMSLFQKTSTAVVLEGPLVAGRYCAPILASRCTPRVVFDTIDLHHVREYRRLRHLGASKDEAARSTDSMRQIELSLTAAADATLVLSSEERRVLTAAGSDNSRLFDVPIVHQVDRGPTNPPASRSDLLFVGNVRHAPNLDAIEFLLEEIFPAVQKLRPGTVLHLAGFDTDAIETGDDPAVVAHGWVSDTELVELHRRCHVMVAPMRFGAGMKGKIGEAMGLGLPVVTTRVGAEGFGPTSSEALSVQDSAEEFAELTVRLLEDDQLWWERSRRGRSLIAEFFAPDVVAGSILSAFDDHPKMCAGPGVSVDPS